jgi:hypothetical protein
MKLQCHRYKTFGFQHGFSHLKLQKFVKDTNASTVTLVTALVDDAQAQRKNKINCSKQQCADRK